MKTFYVETLGCKVNQYESEQLVAMLRARGLSPADAWDADLRIVNTCSVTSQAASQSRQTTRRLVRLGLPKSVAASGEAATVNVAGNPESAASTAKSDRRVVVVGCWATSDTEAARNLNGVDAVLTHHDDLSVEFDRLLSNWMGAPQTAGQRSTANQTINPPAITSPPLAVTHIQVKGEKAAARSVTGENKPKIGEKVNDIPASLRGARSLPLLGDRQASRQRAFVKVQDGCDAHCTYCIIPNLRPTLWSKPVEQVVDEVRRLVDAGHNEIVLTGIFLGAYGHPTALHRRQNSEAQSLAKLVEALADVRDLRRLRLSSIEPGDLTSDLLDALAGSPQVVPHFHLPLQSGSDLILRRMNRQYNRGDFLAMVERINARFDRPALTTDIIVGFPGEDDAEFEQTADVARQSGFIHIHAFPYSPRPGTAAARWSDQFIHGPVVNQRVAKLTNLAADASLAFRKSFLGEAATVILERGQVQHRGRAYRHGRTERYFPVLIDDDAAFDAGDELIVQIDRVDGSRTFRRDIDGSIGVIAVVQRVSEASVDVEGDLAGSIGLGLVALVAVCKTDTMDDVTWTARKLTDLRLFPAGDKHFDIDVRAAGGSILLISNFTVAAETSKGRRPSFVAAADAEQGGALFAALLDEVRSLGVPVQTGRFRSDMKVRLVNDGPATVLINSANR